MLSMTCQEFLTAISRKRTFDHGDVMETPLKRCLSTTELIFIGIGITITGVFSLPGLIVMEAGPAAIISQLIAGVTVIMISLSYIEMCCRLPRAGSSYSYVYVTLGELAAFMTGWTIIFVYTLSIGGCSKALSATINVMVNNSISNYLETLPGWPQNVTWIGPYPDFLGFGLVMVAMCIILAGAQVSVWFTAATGSLSLAAMIIVDVVMFVNADWSYLSPPSGFAPAGFQGVLVGAASGFVLFTGFDAMTIASEEVKNPTKTVPLAVLFTLTFGTVFVVISTLALIVFVPYQQVTSPDVAFAVALEQRGFVWTSYVAAVGSIFGLGAAILVSAYALPRVIYSMAQDGLLFSWLGIVWERTQVPGYAALVSTLLAALTALIFSFNWFANSSSIAAMFAYSIVVACVVVLRFQKPKRFLNQTFELTKLDEDGNPLGASESDKSPQSESDDDHSKQKQKQKQKQKKTLDRTESESTPLVQANECDCDDDRVGQLRPCAEDLPLPREVKTAKPGVVAVSALAVFVALAVVFTLVLIYLFPEISSGLWWSEILLVFFATLLVLPLAVMYLYRRNDETIKTFRVPCTPLVPVISLTLNFLLIFALASVTWATYFIWLAVGLTIYFSYGMFNVRAELTSSSPAEASEK